MAQGFCHLIRNQEKGVLSNGAFGRVQCHAQGNRKYARIMVPAVHLAFRAPQPREAYTFAKSNLLKTPFSCFLIYHPFQNHYTHKITIFELFGGLQLQLSGVLQINYHYSYSFLVFNENAVTGKNSTQAFSRIRCNYSYMM